MRQLLDQHTCLKHKSTVATTESPNPTPDIVAGDTSIPYNYSYLVTVLHRHTAPRIETS